MKREWKDLTSSQRKGVEVLSRTGRPMTTREILKAMGEKNVTKGMISNYRRILVRLEKYGVLKRPDPGFFQFILGSLDGSVGDAPEPTSKSNPPPVSKSLVVDPWGDEVTEAEVRKVIGEAVLIYLKDLRKRRKHDEAIRVAFLCGAYLTGRPMPHVEQVVKHVPVPSPEAVSTPESSKSKLDKLSLPKGWTMDTYLEKAKTALSKGLLDPATVSEKLGDVSVSYVEKVLRGKVEPTDEMIERFFAATYQEIMSL